MSKSTKFNLNSDRDVTVIFEPTAAEYQLGRDKTILVQWVGDSDDGAVRFRSDCLVVWAPSDGYVRAWEESGLEIYIGPESE